MTTFANISMAWRVRERDNRRLRTSELRQTRVNRAKLGGQRGAQPLRKEGSPGISLPQFSIGLLGEQITRISEAQTSVAISLIDVSNKSMIDPEAIACSKHKSQPMTISRQSCSTLTSGLGPWPTANPHAQASPWLRRFSTGRPLPAKLDLSPQHRQQVNSRFQTQSVLFLFIKTYTHTTKLPAAAFMFNYFIPIQNVRM